MAFKLSEWNDIVKAVNAKLAECGGTALAEAGPNHIWAVADLLAVRNALTAQCESTFSVPLTKWSQALLDEINAAVENCECGAEIVRSYTISFRHGPTYTVSSGLSSGWYTVRRARTVTISTDLYDSLQDDDGHKGYLPFFLASELSQLSDYTLKIESMLGTTSHFHFVTSPGPGTLPAYLPDPTAAETGYKWGSMYLFENKSVPVLHPLSLRLYYDEIEGVRPNDCEITIQAPGGGSTPELAIARADAALDTRVFAGDQVVKLFASTLGGLVL